MKFEIYIQKHLQKLCSYIQECFTLIILEKKVNNFTLKSWTRSQEISGDGHSNDSSIKEKTSIIDTS